jgi:hypothetical protein
MHNDLRFETMDDFLRRRAGRKRGESERERKPAKHPS